MKLSVAARLTRLLLHLSRFSPHRPPGVEERRDLSIPGTSAHYDLYSPRKGSRQTIVALHGLTVHGGRDRRLEFFARCLARSGATCIVPTLPGLAACSLEPDDIDVLRRLVEAHTAAAGAGMGIIGFSYGGSYALVAASLEEIATRVRFVLTFGAYHSLDTLSDWYLARDDVAPATEDEWDNLIYLHLVLAYQLREKLPQCGALKPQVRSLLERYCSQASAQEKRAFYETYLKPLEVVRAAAPLRDPAVHAALSPAGKLEGLACPVGLIHDPTDSIVPPEHAALLLAELEKAGREACPGGTGRHGAGRDGLEARHRCLVTPLLSHVDLASVLDVGQLRALLATLTPLVEG